MKAELKHLEDGWYFIQPRGKNGTRMLAIDLGPFSTEQEAERHRLEVERAFKAAEKGSLDS